MNKQILKQYVDLQQEEKDLLRRIQKVKGQIERIEKDGLQVADAVACGKRGKKPLGIKKIHGVPDPEYHKLKKQLKTYELQLQLADEHLLATLMEAEQYIQSIEDSKVRRILRYRYIDEIGWVQIAHRMGRKYTAESCRKIHDRFFEKK